MSDGGREGGRKEGGGGNDYVTLLSRVMNTACQRETEIDVIVRIFANVFVDGNKMTTSLLSGVSTGISYSS